MPARTSKQEPSRRAALSLLGIIASTVVGCQREEADGETCRPWLPSGEAWSSLETSRPATMSALTASADGRFLYAIGTWISAGMPRNDLFRSSDLGTTWCVLTTPEQPQILAPSPATPDRIYALSSSDPTGPATHLMTTADAGKTWSLADAPASDSGSLVPTVEDTNGVWFLHARGAAFVSRDAGKAWSPVLPPPDAGVIVDFVVDPASTERALVRIRPQGADRFFVTSDAGVTWSEISSQVGPTSGLVQMLFGADASLYLATNGTVSKSVDSGQSWNVVAPLPDSPGSLLNIGPPATDLLFAGGAHGFWRSVDGGATWQSISVPAPDFSPELAGVTGPDVIVGEVPSAFTVSRDAGRSWEQRPLVPTVSSLMQSPVPTAPLSSAWPIWSTSPNLRSADGGVTWSSSSFEGNLVMDGASSDVLFDFQPQSAVIRRSENGGRTWDPLEVPTDLTEIHGVASCPPPHSCLYVLYRNAEDSMAFPSHLLRSDDHGRTWGRQIAFSAVDSTDTPLFFLPLAVVVSPNDSDLLFADGGHGLAESRDGGHTWTSQALPGVFEVRSIVAYEGGTLLVASENSCCGQGPDVVLRSLDGGATWTKVLQASGDLVVSRAEPNTVFLLSNGVWRSNDRGASWSNVAPRSLRDTIVPVGIADAQGGGFVLALQQNGFVHFD